MTEQVTIKLISGQEVIGTLLENIDGSLTVQDPVLINRNMTPFGIQVTCTPWLMFTDNQSISIGKDKIVAFNLGLDDNSKDQYESFVKNVIHGDLKEAKKAQLTGGAQLGFNPDDPAMQELEEEIKAYMELSQANTVLH